MSAIYGIYQKDQEPNLRELGMSLRSAFQRFPADESQMWQGDRIFFGCHAQWITSESIGERLPFYDAERQLTITADAIIDNRDELFEKLEVEYSRRKHIPDSQLIILAYRKWGEQVTQHLIGDFAFMIWDEKEQKLFGARDFSGARTLYYYQDADRFAFSTIIEPLFRISLKKKLNEEWLAEFIAIPYMLEAVDMNSTVYRGIHQVPPSHTITISNGSLVIKRYNMIDFHEQLKLKSNEEYEEAFRDVLQKAVTSRIRTFGKVGAQLSGGLDSGSVVSIASNELRKQNKKLYSFSYVPVDDYEDWTSKYFIADERPLIRETVSYVGNISDYYLSFDGRDPLTELDDFLKIMEMPYKFFSNSFWLKGMSDEAQRKGIKILLNGARGNYSISWGSIPLTLNYYTSLFKKLRLIQLYRELSLYCNNFKTGKSVMIPAIARRAVPFLESTKQSDYQFPHFINPTLARKTSVFEKLQALGVDITGNLGKNPNDIRRQHFEKSFYWNKTGTATTKLSLRYSVWDRDPTNDIRVIRFCLAVPEEQYTIGGMERALVRRATKNLLPDSVRLHRGSRGLQSADLIQRMKGNWGDFTRELHELTANPIMEDLVDCSLIKKKILNYQKPHPNVILDDDFTILTRSLVIYRFVKQFT